MIPLHPKGMWYLCRKKYLFLFFTTFITPHLWHFLAHSDYPVNICEWINECSLPLQKGKLIYLKYLDWMCCFITQMQSSRLTISCDTFPQRFWLYSLLLNGWFHSQIRNKIAYWNPVLISKSDQRKRKGRASCFWKKIKKVIENLSQNSPAKLSFVSQCCKSHYRPISEANIGQENEITL